MAVAPLDLLAGSPGATPAAGGAAPYATSVEHLRAELERVDLLLRLRVARGGSHAERARPHPAALSDEEDDLYALFHRGPSPTLALPAPPPPAVAEAEDAARRMLAEIERRRAESARRGAPPRLAALAERFGLDRLDLDILLLALLPEVVRASERLFARLDPAGRGRPTAGAALEIACPTFEARLAARARFGPRAPLLRHSLVHLIADPGDGRVPLVSRAVAIDERIAAHLQGDDHVDARLGAHARAITPRARLEELLLPSPIKEGLARVVRRREREAAPGPVVYLQGPYGAGKRTLAEALCRELDVPLLAVDGAALLGEGAPVFAAAASLAAREARLRGAALLWTDADAALDSTRPEARAALLAALADHDGPAFLAGREPWGPAGTLAGRPFLRVELPRPGAAAQAELWARALGDDRGDDIELAALTGAFRLTGGQIRDAAEAARCLARYRGAEEGRVGMADLKAACSARLGRKLGALARRIEPRHGWDDLVLPADRKAVLRELCQQLKHRSRVLGEWGFERRLAAGRPLAALFTGPPGTGKTMAAGIIAAELGVALYHIDLSRVVSKYIGETEKHLGELFEEAEAASAGLFFDEADALFGKRTEVRDAHDRYANQETSYLLQRIEAYEGVVLLATNLAKNMDEAFVRRLGFVVEFPAPGAAERRRIWEGLWPAEAPVGEDVDMGFLAERIELSGGYLRNIALAAAFLAAEEGGVVKMRHVLHAAKREYQKIGKVVEGGRLSYSTAADAVAPGFRPDPRGR